MTSGLTFAGRARSARPARRASKRRWVLLSMIAPALLGLVIFFVYPLVASVVFSFTRFDLASPPQWIGLDNYVFLFTKDPNVWLSAGNTLWFVVILVPVKIVAAMAVAALLTTAKRAAGLWRTLFYLPALVPPVASTVMFVFLFTPGNGPVNTILGWFGIKGPLWFSDPALSKPSLVLLGVWMMGEIMIIFLAAMLDVPKELHEAASLDGANVAVRWRYVTLPHLSPVILFAFVVGVVAALQYFTEASVASSVASGNANIGSQGESIAFGYPEGSLLTYAQWLYVRGFGQFQLGYASALAVLLFVVTSVFLVLLLRRVRAFTPENAS